jgi:hypothetical protein
LQSGSSDLASFALPSHPFALTEATKAQQDQGGHDTSLVLSKDTIISLQAQHKINCVEAKVLVGLPQQTSTASSSSETQHQATALGYADSHQWQ